MSDWVNGNIIQFDDSWQYLTLNLLLKSHIPVRISQNTKYSVISRVNINDSGNGPVILIGVHIPFDDGTYFRFGQYKSNFDLKRGRRYDELLRHFMVQHNFDFYDYLF